MKTKKLKKQLNELVEQVEVSDVDTQFLNKVTYKPTFKENKNKKFVLISSLTMSFAALSIAFFLFTFFINRPDISIGNLFPPLTSTISLKEEKLTEVKRKLAYQTIGCYSIIEGVSNMGKLNLATSGNQRIEQEIKENLLLARNYLDLANADIKLYVSNKEGYAYMYKMMMNNEEIWFYFNETTSIETDDIDEVSSSIEGILCMNHQNYPVRGTKTVESNEIETTLIIELSENEKIEVSQEIENRENEYEFQIYKNEKLVKTLEIEIEQLFDYNIVSIEEEDFENDTSKSIEYHLKNQQIICEYEINGDEGEVAITIQGNSYYFEYMRKSQSIQVLKNYL